MNNKSYKYPLLNDHDWLYKNYITNSLSTNKMRDMVGCKTSNSVRQALIRHGISLRNISEGFYPENVKRLVEKLCNTTEMEFKMSPCNSGYGYRITLQQHYTNSFFQIHRGMSS